MSELRIFQDSAPRAAIINSQEPERIAAQLKTVGIRFEQWPIRSDTRAGDAPEKILADYDSDIQRLVAEQGYQTVDVISLDSSHPDKAALREKFLSEHTHSEDEVRFFVRGQGLFALHIGDKVFEVLCTQGDLLSVPANTPHWFDLGPAPELVAIRFFDNPEGWVANYTGSDIAENFSRIEA